VCNTVLEKSLYHQTKRTNTRLRIEFPCLDLAIILSIIYRVSKRGHEEWHNSYQRVLKSTSTRLQRRDSKPDILSQSPDDGHTLSLQGIRAALHSLQVLLKSTRRAIPKAVSPRLDLLIIRIEGIHGTPHEFSQEFNSRLQAVARNCTLKALLRT
jgi:hypothetical protein